MSDETVPWRPDASGGDDARVLDGRYRLGERLGGGAVAEVVRAFDVRLARPVAVKLFRGDAAEQLHRHEAEMRTLARLDHPNLVTVYDAGTAEDTDQPYLVMQLIEGHTLADELRDGPLPRGRIASHAAEIADALDYVHERGFVHRDVKPANVLVSNDGRVHLADFGIARLVDSAHVTKTGDVVGTPAYFAPEQVSGGTVGPPADIYALGLMVLECLTGSRPYDGTAMEVAMARLARDPEVPATVPRPWADAVLAMTAREPDARPSAREVATLMRDFSAGVVDTGDFNASAGTAATQTVAMPRVASPRPRRRRTALWLTLLLVAVAAAAGGGVALARHQSSSGSPAVPPATHQPPLHPASVENVMRDLEALVRP